MKLLPINEWAKKNGLTKTQAVNLVRSKKIPMTLLPVVELRWHVPENVTAKRIAVFDEKTGRKKKKWLIT